MPDAEQVTDAIAYHGEGPLWDAVAGRVRWVDMLRGDILALDRATGDVERTHVGSVAAALRPRRGGGFVIAVQRGFALLDPGSSCARSLPEVWTDDSVRMNDGTCDPQGRFYAGSMAYDAGAGRGSLYRLDPDHRVSTVLTGVTISNGICWSPDGGTVFYVDTMTQRIDAFDFDADRGTFTARRPVVRIPADAGAPDGLTIDADGGLWVALYNGAAVHRYTPEGRLDEVVRLPVPRVTSCAFAGPDLDELYITTSREGVPDGEQPQAGALFRVRTGRRGLPVAAFAG